MYGLYLKPFVSLFAETINSRSRALLLKEILAKSDHAKLFAVGDDWQSIYRFSGSDTNYVSHFEQIFGTATILELDTTYRFPEELNLLTANFVTQNPAQLKKGMHALEEMKHPCALMRDVRSCVRIPENINPDAVEEYANQQPAADCYKDAIEFYLRQFAKKVAQRDGKDNKVLLLGRNRQENMYCMSSLKSIDDLNDLRKAFPELQLDYKTAHSSKGLEADYVIVIGNDNSRKLFKSTLNNCLHSNLACVIAKMARSAKLNRAFEELPQPFLLNVKATKSLKQRSRWLRLSPLPKSVAYSMLQ